jgi:protease-4
MTMRGLVESLRLAKRDPRITGVLLMPSSIDSPYWGKVQELRDAVLDFRKSGKVVVGFLEYGGIASTTWRARRIAFSAAHQLARHHRHASYEVFSAVPSTRSGAFPDFLQIGAYKTAVNQLTQNTFTPEHREMAESLNDDMYQQLVRGIASARKKTEAETRQLLDEGPFSPEDAVRYGLVDGLAYEDQLDDRVPQLRQAARCGGSTAAITSASRRARWSTNRCRASPCSTRRASSRPERAATTLEQVWLSAPTPLSSSCAVFETTTP